MNTLKHLIESIKPPDAAIMTLAKQKIDGLLKPTASLGRLESLAIQLAGISQTLDLAYPRKKIIVMCADHGVHAENITISPQIVTYLQALNIQKNITGVCVFAHNAGAEVLPIDVGIQGEAIPNMLSYKTRQMSGNIAKEPAMTREEAINLLTFSAEQVHKEVKQGLNLLGIGELGMGNTTPAAAMISVLCGVAAEEVVGVGANYPKDQLHHKISVVKQAIMCNQPDPCDGVDVLAKVGGFDLCGMTGLILGAASAGIPVVLDGFLSYAAALAALKMSPMVRYYLIPSHASAEKGTHIALQNLQLTAYFDMDLRLGEGSGAALMFPFVDAASSMLSKMGSLAADNIVLPH